jgi:hypothetical protein
LATGDNYSNWRQPPGALTKDKLATEWAKNIYAKGVKVERSGKQVRNKIDQIEAQFKAAHNWSHGETGTGLQEADIANGTTTFKESVRMLFLRHSFALIIT